MIYGRDVVFDTKWSFLSTENPSAQGELKPISQLLKMAMAAIKTRPQLASGTTRRLACILANLLHRPLTIEKLKPVISPSSVKVAGMTRLKSFSSPLH